MSNAEFQPIDPAVVPRFADVATFMRTRRHEITETCILDQGGSMDIGVVCERLLSNDDACAYLIAGAKPWSFGFCC